MAKNHFKISIKNAKTDKLFYFVATSTVYNKKTGKCLILKRSKKEKVHPGKWAVPGGKLEHQDLQGRKKPKGDQFPAWLGMVEELIKREVKEECGLNVSNVTHIGDVVYIRPDNVPVVCLKFASVTKSAKAKLAPEFDQFAWVNDKEVKKYNTIKSVAPEVIKTIKIFGRKNAK